MPPNVAPTVPADALQQQIARIPEKIYQLVLDLTHPQKREGALLGMLCNRENPIELNESLYTSNARFNVMTA